MIELGLTIIEQNSQDIERLRKRLDQFEAAQAVRVRVQIKALSWSEGWNEMVRIATYNAGPDVSAVGTSWAPDLAGMDALLPYTEKQVAFLGGQASFYPASWQSAGVLGDPRIWAVPWMAGCRVLYYRRDWLAEHGVSEAAAFHSALTLSSTFRQLKTGGVERLWVVTTQPSLNTAHHLASWVWGANGDWVDADNPTRLQFTHMRTLAGMQAYFALAPYLGPQPELISDSTAAEMFWSGQAAATIAGHWLYPRREQFASPQVLENLGVAQVPGAPFVGGTNLVVWKHTRYPEAAIELVRFLCEPEVVLDYQSSSGLLPAKRGGLEALPTLKPDEEPVYRLIEQSLQVGRPWPNVPRCSLLEDRLKAALGEIWHRVLTEQPADIIGILTRVLYPMQRRFEWG